MENEKLNQNEIDQLVKNISKKRKAKKNGKLSQAEIDQVIQEYVTLTNTNLTQSQIDEIISSFDDEFKPEN